jgi:hypothetical protein
MKKTTTLAHVLLGLCLSLPAASLADQTSTPSGEHKDHKIVPMDEKNLGEIAGTVKTCEAVGPAGLELHLIGHSVTARLGDSGEFTLHHIPPGNHTLVFEKGPKDVLTLTQVPVEPQSLTVVGEIKVCPGNGTGDKKTFDPSILKQCPQGGFICPHVERLK